MWALRSEGGGRLAAEAAAAAAAVWLDDRGVLTSFETWRIASTAAVAWSGDGGGSSRAAEASHRHTQPPRSAARAIEPN